MSQKKSPSRAVIFGAIVGYILYKSIVSKIIFPNGLGDGINITSLILAGISGGIFAALFEIIYKLYKSKRNFKGKDEA